MKLSKLQYFEVLQKEWFRAELLRKIHIKKSDKAYYKKVMDKKKAKILDISREIYIDSIFEDREYHHKVRCLVYPTKDSCLPQFEMTKKQIMLYFSKGSEVKVKNEEGGFDIAKIETPVLEKNILFVKKRGSNGVMPVPIQRVFRIL